MRNNLKKILVLSVLIGLLVLGCTQSQQNASPSPSATMYPTAYAAGSPSPTATVDTSGMDSVDYEASSLDDLNDSSDLGQDIPTSDLDG